MQIKDEEFRKIFDEISALIHRFILFRTKDKALADDILQEVFLRLYKNQDKITSKESVKSWLYTVAKNSIVDYYRKHNRTEIATDMKETVMYEDEKFDSELSNCVIHFISALPQKYSEILDLYEYERFSAQEIATKLDMPIATVKSRIQRGRKQLKESLLNCCDFTFDKEGMPLEAKPKCCKSPKCLKDF